MSNRGVSPRPHLFTFSPPCHDQTSKDPNWWPKVKKKTRDLKCHWYYGTQTKSENYRAAVWQVLQRSRSVSLATRAKQSKLLVRGRWCNFIVFEVKFIRTLSPWANSKISLKSWKTVWCWDIKTWAFWDFKVNFWGQLITQSEFHLKVLIRDKLIFLSKENSSTFEAYYVGSKSP